MYVHVGFIGKVIFIFEKSYNKFKIYINAVLKMINDLRKEEKSNMMPCLTSHTLTCNGLLANKERILLTKMCFISNKIISISVTNNK